MVVLGVIRASSDEREIKAQRATVPGVGGHSTRMLELTDVDKRFPDYVRTGKKKALVLDTTSQYLVSPAVEQEIERRLAEEVTIRKLTSKKTINKDRIQVRDIGNYITIWPQTFLAISSGRLVTSTAYSL